MAKKGSRKKKKATPGQIASQHDIMKRLQWEDKRNAMAEGRRQRATQFKNKKKDSNKNACRDNKNWY